MYGSRLDANPYTPSTIFCIKSIRNTKFKSHIRLVHAVESPPPFSFVLTEDGTNFAPKRLTEFVLKIKDMS